MKKLVDYTAHVKISMYRKCQRRSRRKLEDNTRKKNSREVDCENAGWIEVTGDSVHMRSFSVPQNAVTSRIAKELPAFLRRICSTQVIVLDQNGLVIKLSFQIRTAIQQFR